MIPAIGHLSLILSFLLAIGLSLSVLTFRFGTVKQTAALSYMLVLGMWLSLTSAFGILIYSHVVSDFSVVNVVNNSHSSKPLLYKISGVWGNHEGSMLLWSWLLVSITALFTLLSRMDCKDKCGILSLQGILSSGFLAFILATSNPFLRIFPPAKEGAGLNPLLQDIGLAMHPPCLYIGYVGFSLGFSAAISALIKGEADRSWAHYLKPWVMLAWSFLTIGIALGSWWAYRELGWGGFWFWDPVENASLMPWLMGTALLHSLIVVEKRNQLKSWTLLLALLTFALSLLGTFLVRSGVLTSVHSFANDPERGFFILVFLTVVVGVSLSLFAMRAHCITVTGGFSPLSRESFILFNNLILATACATILLGTLYPIFYELFAAKKLSIGAPYFASTFIPITLPLLGLCAIGSWLKWKHDIFQLRKYTLPAGIALLAGTSSFFLLPPANGLASIAIGFGVWLVIAMVIEWKERFSLPLSFHGMVIAHIGLGIMVISLAFATAGFKEVEQLMQPGDTLHLAGYRLTLKALRYEKGPNYLVRKAALYVETKKGNEVTTLQPERRFYPVENTSTSESSLYSTVFGDLYTAMGEMEGEKVAIRVYYRPLINGIWAGALLMALGGMITLLRPLLKKP